MDKSLLVKLMGFPATLIHGDTLVLDRWLWLKSRLPRTRNGEKLLDIGCGSGAFCIGASLRGYNTLGLSWDERNQNVASDRATLCRVKHAKFEVVDVRMLDVQTDKVGKYDVALCCENIEHIIDDVKLLRDISGCLKPGGRLLLTTPYLLYYPITADDMGPFSTIEDGWHVRRGYSKTMLVELCKHAGFEVEDITYCSGFLSQKLTKLMRCVGKLNPSLGWLIVLPLRIMPVLFDKVIAGIFGYPYYSICLEAYKPRYGYD